MKQYINAQTMPLTLETKEATGYQKKLKYSSEDDCGPY